MHVFGSRSESPLKNTLKHSSTRFHIHRKTRRNTDLPNVRFGYRGTLVRMRARLEAIWTKELAEAEAASRADDGSRNTTNVKKR